MAKYRYLIPLVDGKPKYRFERKRRERIYSWIVHTRYVEIVCSRVHEELDKEDVIFEEVG